LKQDSQGLPGHYQFDQQHAALNQSLSLRLTEQELLGARGYKPGGERGLNSVENFVHAAEIFDMHSLAQNGTVQLRCANR
jgi:hypothetical protein